MYRTLWDSRLVHLFDTEIENEFGRRATFVFPFTYHEDIDVEVVEDIIKLREEALTEFDRIISGKKCKIISFVYTEQQQTLGDFVYGK